MGFFKYYIWHIVFSVLILACIIFLFISFTTTSSSDVLIGYIGTKYINIQTFEDSKAQFEILLQDSNDDDKKTAYMVANIFDKQKDVDEAFADAVDNYTYNIYIATKSTFENFKDKSKFEDAETYMNVNEKKHVVLKDSSGRVYAISIEDNEFTTSLGINEPEDLYIAVAAPEDAEDISQNIKNARNITQYLITEG